MLLILIEPDGLLASYYYQYSFTNYYRCLRKWTKKKRSVKLMIESSANSPSRRRQNLVNRCSHQFPKSWNPTMQSLSPTSKSSRMMPKTKSTLSLTTWTSSKRKPPSSRAKLTMRIAQARQIRTKQQNPFLKTKSRPKTKPLPSKKAKKIAKMRQSPNRHPNRMRQKVFLIKRVRWRRMRLKTITLTWPLLKW
jgi:hypothetical protein